MAKILNDVLCTIMFFLLTFAWATFCLKDWKTALLLAAIVALCAGYILFRLLSRTENKRKNTKKHKKILADFAIFLRFNSNNNVLFSSLFCYYNFIATSIDFDNIIISKNERIYVALLYQTEAISAEKLQQAVVSAKRNECCRLLIFGCKAEVNMLALADTQIPTKFLDLANTYELFEQADLLPKIPEISLPKPHILPQIAFSKKRFMWYFLGAMYSLVLSFFSFFKVYLLGWATALFCLALFSITNRRYNPKPTNISPNDF